FSSFAPESYGRTTMTRFISLARQVIAAVSTVGLPLAANAQRDSQSVSVLLRPQQVFDAVSDQLHPGWAVLVTGNKIVAAGPASDIRAPAAARTIDLAGMTLLPGLSDLHSHVFLHPYNEATWNDQVLKETAAYRTIIATVHSERTLMAGFTT